MGCYVSWWYGRGWWTRWSCYHYDREHTEWIPTVYASTHHMEARVWFLVILNCDYYQVTVVSPRLRLTTLFKSHYWPSWGEGMAWLSPLGFCGCKHIGPGARRLTQIFGDFLIVLIGLYEVVIGPGGFHFHPIGCEWQFYSFLLLFVLRRNLTMVADFGPQEEVRKLKQYTLKVSWLSLVASPETGRENF